MQISPENKMKLSTFNIPISPRASIGRGTKSWEMWRIASEGPGSTERISRSPKLNSPISWERTWCSGRIRPAIYHHNAMDGNARPTNQWPDITCSYKFRQRLKVQDGRWSIYALNLKDKLPIIFIRRCRVSWDIRHASQNTFYFWNLDLPSSSRTFPTRIPMSVRRTQMFWRAMIGEAEGRRQLGERQGGWYAFGRHLGEEGRTQQWKKRNPLVDI